MGAQIEGAKTLDLEQHIPPLDEYQLKHCGPNYYVWQHSIQQDSIIEFPINIPNPSVFKQQVEVYLLRHRHPLLVSSLYLKNNASSGKASVFYQRVYTNLSRIKDIPFQDTLQFYYVALKGFQLLYKRFGYFQIQQSMFHITLNNKVKVWCNKNIEKSKPKDGATNGTMEDMIKRIVRIIQQNSDTSLQNFPIGSIIYEQASSSFTLAIQKLRDVCRLHKFAIPQKLTCLQIINSGDVGILLDQYGQINQRPIFTEQPTHFQQNTSPQINSLLSRANDTSQIRISNTESKMVTAQSPLQISSNIRNSRKTKGLQISHSLQRLNQSKKSAQTHKINKMPLLNFNIAEQTTPFVRLNRQHQILMKQLPQPQPIRSIPIMQVPNPNLVRPNINNLYIPAPQYTQFKSVIPQPQIVKRQFISNIQRPIMQRSNSVDYLNKTNQNFRKSPPQQDYRVVVNYAERPNHSSNFSQFPRPKSQLQMQQNPTIPVPQVNNFLTVASPSVPASPCLPSPISNQLNINRFFPSQMSKQQYGYGGHPKTNTQLSSQYSQNQNQQSSVQIKNKRYQNNLLNCTNTYKKQNYLVNDTLSNNFADNKKQQKYTPLKDYTNFKSRFEQYKRNFDYTKKDASQICFKQEPKHIRKTFNQKYETENLNLNKNINDKPFFNGILKQETVVSNYDTNQCLKSQDTDRKVQTKIKNDAINEFPSVTDVSDNISYYPSVKKPVETQNLWREESVVVKHDPNQSKIKMPESRKYEPQIDSEIWADMMKVRRKLKQA